jgi:hypothetical protein
LPLQPEQALATTLLHAFWHAMMAALGQVRSVQGCQWLQRLCGDRKGPRTVESFALGGEGAGESRGGKAEDREDDGGLHFGSGW